MNFFSCRSRWSVSGLFGLMMVLISSAALAADYTWDGDGGDGNPALNSAVNWVDDTLPPFIATSDVYYFEGASPTVPIVVPSGGVGMEDVYFNEGCAAFTFAPTSDPVADAITMGDSDNSTTLRNDSENTQTFNVYVSIGRGSVLADDGDLVFNSLLNIGGGGQTSYTKYYGSHDIHINGGLVGMGAIGTNYSTGGNFVVGNTSGALGGTVYITADSPLDTDIPGYDLNEGDGRWNGMCFIYNNNLRISTPYALGEGGESAGYTIIRSGDSVGALELVGNISVNEKLRLDGRNADTAVQLVNVSDNNTLTGPLYMQVGTNVGIQSDAGTLTIQGDLTATAGSAGTRILHLRGASNGRMEGKLDASDGFVTLSLNKYDGGTWTLTNANNYYTGATTISGGTLALEGSGAIASTPSIDVQNGAFFDVSGLSSTFTLAYAQILMGTGTVTGNVQDTYNAKIVPGTSGTAGTLSVDGNLALNGSGELLFDLADVNTVGSGVNDLLTVNGNLSLMGTTTMTVNPLNVSLAQTTYQLFNYSGTLMGDATNFYLTPIGGTTRQSFSIKTGNDLGGTPNQVNLIVTGAPLSLTWKGDGVNNVWEVVGTSTNWNNNTEKFYDQDYVTFDDTGSSSPDVSLSGNLSPTSITVNNSMGHDYVFSGNGALVGSSGLTKNGTGKLTIANSWTNEFSGEILVNGGTLEVGAAGYYGNLGPGTVTLGPSGTLTFNRLDDIAVSNELSGSGMLEKKGSGVATLMGTTSNFSGPVTVTEGTLKVTDSLGTADTLPDVTDNALLQLGGSSSLTFTRRITGSGNLEKVDTNTVYLASDNNNYSGTTTITSGALSVGTGGATGSLGGTGDITLGDDGTLRYYRWGTNDVSRNVVGSGKSSEAVRYGYTNLDFRDAVYNVSGNNTYTGDTWVYGGTVVLSSATGLGDSITGKTVIDNANGFPCVALTGGISVAEYFEMQPRTGYTPIAVTYAPHIQNNSGHNTLSGTVGTGTGGGGSQYTIRSAGTETGDLLTISGSILCERPNASCGLRLCGPGNGEITGAITKLTDCDWTNVSIDGGEWTLSGANDYTGPTTIFPNTTLKLTGSGSIASTSAIILQGATSVLDVLGLSVPELSLVNNQNLIGVGTVKGDLSSLYSTTTVSPSGTGTLSGENLPGGTMTITKNVNFTGSEILQFKLADDDASPNNDKIAVTENVLMPYTTVSIVPGTSLETGVSYTLLTAANDFMTAGSYFILDPNHNTRYSLTLNTSTPGQLKLDVGLDTNKSLTWTGTGASADWDVRGSYNWKDNVEAAEQFYQADFVTFGDTVPEVATTVNLTATVYPALITMDSAQDYTISGTGKISSDASIVKQGTGTLTLSTANDFNGTVTINEGTVKIGASKALGSYAGGVIIHGGTFDLSGYYQPRRESISVQGSGTGGDGALVNNASNKTSGVDPYLYYVTLTDNAVFGGTYDWSIEGDVIPFSGWAAGYLHGNNKNLTKTGSNEIGLNNLGTTNLGDITVTEGTLTVSGSTDLGASTITLSNNAVLKLSDATQTVEKTLDVAATGGVIDNHAGNNTIAGSGGTLSGLLTVHTADGTTLILDNALSGTGGLTKDEEGTLLLSGANSYQGDTTVTAGVLEIGSTGQMTGSTILNSAVLQVDSGTHTVKAVQGTGVMNVLASANVTVGRLAQNTLTVAAGAKVVIAPLPAGSRAAAPVPEPGTWLLLLIGLLGFAGWRKIHSPR